MKIAVYGISKNEERFALRWADTCKDADYRIVVDTGSTDGTIERLKKSGVRVIEKTISPWRFDNARNAALAEIPEDADICISLDMDELLSPGWRKAVERAWEPGTTQLRYSDVRNFNPDGSAQRVIAGFKVHSRQGFRWNYAVHEILCSTGKVVERFCADLQVHHRPDPSKQDKGYLAIIEKLIEEEPEESHYRYYLGLELIARGELVRAILALDAFLQLATLQDGLRRSNAFHLKAWCRKNLGQDARSIFADLVAAARETPEQREVWGRLAAFSGECGRWVYALAFSQFALRCNDPGKSMFIEPEWWRGKPEQMLASAAEILGIDSAKMKTGVGLVPASLILALEAAVRSPTDVDLWIAGANAWARAGEWALGLAMVLEAASALQFAKCTEDSKSSAVDHLFASGIEALGISPKQSADLWLSASYSELIR